jgi:ABC-type multidrug transport system ATPase subunit
MPSTNTRPALEVFGVTARTPDGTMVLDDVSFALERGTVVAVVGPTGAGKTTLVNALTGALALEAGSVWLDGAPVTPDGEARRRVGVVPQDDVLHGQLDLRRTVRYAAALRMPGSSTASRAKRTASVLAELGLSGQAHLPISTLSGGQRKRANIAAELVGEPELLVLDEPTSGLDPGYEKAVLGTLRQLADAGRTVLVVTHSLQALRMCDRVLFLAAGGRVAFFGPPDEAIAYFGRSDAADVFLALNDEPGHSWKERFRAHPTYARLIAHTHPHGHSERARDQALTATPRPAGRWPDQLSTLLRRYIDLIRADRRLVVMLALQGPLLGLLLWSVLTPDSLAAIHTKSGAVRMGAGAPTVALFLAISATWLGTALAVREIVKEHRILRQERGTGLSVSAYVTSKALTLGVLAAGQAAILTVIACARQGVPASGAVLGSGLAEIAIMAALAGLAAMALGLLISAAVTTPDKALTVLPMALVVQLVFAGPWVSVRSTPGLQQIREITGARWAVTGIEATITGDSTEWWSAVRVLLLLTVGALVATVALAHRRVGVPGRRQLATFSSVAMARSVRVGRPVPALAGAVAMLAISAGAAAVVGSPAPTAHEPIVVAIAKPQTPVLAVPAPTPRTTPPTTVAPPTAATIPTVPVTVPVATTPALDAPADPVVEVPSIGVSVELPPVAVDVTVPPVTVPPVAVPPVVADTADTTEDPWARFARLIWKSAAAQAQAEAAAWPWVSP